MMKGVKMARKVNSEVEGRTRRKGNEKCADCCQLGVRQCACVTTVI